MTVYLRQRHTFLDSPPPDVSTDAHLQAKQSQTDLLDDGEQPTRTAEEFWTELPPDPRDTRQVRHLRLVP
jgi:hypothetical protein